MSAPKQPLRIILASAGSGKTQRLAELVVQEVSSSPPPSVLAITFTRNAAGELRQRILALAAQKNPPILKQLLLGEIPLYTSTIDALVREWYTLLAPLLGLSTYANLIVEDEETIEVSYRLTAELLAQVRQPTFLQALRQQLRNEVQQKAYRLAPDRFLRRHVLAFLRHGFLRNRLKAQLATCRAQLNEEWQKALHLDPTEEKLLPHLENALQAYRQQAQRLFLADVNDLVWLVAHHLPELLAEHAALYQRLFIDEAQDTSPQQWGILKPLIDELTSQSSTPWVTLIGDPKQSIYAWRGADYHTLLNFWQQATQQEVLDQNYRSRPKIVSFNNCLYTYLLCFLEQKSQKQSSASDHRKYALQELANLYKSDWVVQKASSPPAGSWTGKVEVWLLSPSDPDAERADHLKRILGEVAAQGIAPEETAFLVRANDDIERLLALLPGQPLQIREKPLGSCASLAATWQALAEFPQLSPVTQHFLKVETGCLPCFIQQIEELSETLQSAGVDALAKWQAWEKLAAIWQTTPRKAETLYWDFFLSRLYELLHEHAHYDAQALLRWWEEKGRYIPVEMPPQPGYYPVLTIHKAKGLAWRAVILPFVNWSLLEARWHSPHWTRVELQPLPEPVQDLLEGQRPLSELPLKITANAKDSSLKALYSRYFAQTVVENVNLHYVATTRPREGLYLLVDPPPKNNRITWASFWAEKWEFLQHLKASTPYAVR
ncbi:MAG: hypothetical protein KatS3mg026_1229 [Bacteroidia bacterium]|nr:MAG: hypothetical protein KatS3mg026_1229 [Bacteroidia bacterium]